MTSRLLSHGGVHWFDPGTAHQELKKQIRKGIWCSPEVVTPNPIPQHRSEAAGAGNPGIMRAKMQAPARSSACSCRVSARVRSQKKAVAGHGKGIPTKMPSSTASRRWSKTNITQQWVTNGKNDNNTYAGVSWVPTRWRINAQADSTPGRYYSRVSPQKTKARSCLRLLGTRTGRSSW